MSKSNNKIRLAVFKFSSCDGCQLQILNAEDELLRLAQLVDIAYFMEAKRDWNPGPYDVALVEGAVSTPEEEELVKKIRSESKIVIPIGACATAGGIQALRNWANVEEFKKIVYPNPEWISALAKATPISDHVQVDLELRGCPISREQLIFATAQLLKGKRPYIPSYSVCMECKRKGNACVVVAHGVQCLGPVTMDGCGAICPSYDRGCYGCFGPMDQPNPKAMAEYCISMGLSKENIARLFKLFTGYSEKFREVVDEYE